MSIQITSTYQNLAKADLLGGKPDAFVDVSLAPGTHKEMKTKYAKKMFRIFCIVFSQNVLYLVSSKLIFIHNRTIKNNSNPTFQEEFIFNGALDEVVLSIIVKKL